MVAGEDAHLSRGHGIIVRAAGDARYVHSIHLAQIGVFELFAHKRAIIAHRHICHMKVRHQIVFLAAAVQLSLIKILKKMLLHRPQSAA